MLTGPPPLGAVHVGLGGRPVPRSSLRVPSPLRGSLVCRPERTGFPVFRLSPSRPGVSGRPPGPRKPLVTGPPAKWGGQQRTESFSPWVPQRRSGMPAPHPVALRGKCDAERGAPADGLLLPWVSVPADLQPWGTSGDEQVRASACPWGARLLTRPLCVPVSITQEGWLGTLGGRVGAPGGREAPREAGRWGGCPGRQGGAPGGGVGTPGGGVGLGLGVWPGGNRSVSTQLCGPRKCWVIFSDGFSGSVQSPWA